MKKNKIIAVILSVCCVLSVVFTIPVFAEENDYPFSFDMKQNCKKSYSSDSYERITKYTDNPWKVNMTYNAEGSDAKATYFIATSVVHTQCSDSHTIKAGSGNHYYKAYETATDKYIKLGVKNNNDVAKKYTVSGYWDEEIGKRMSGLQ